MVNINIKKYIVFDSVNNQNKTIKVSDDSVQIDDAIYIVEVKISNTYHIRFERTNNYVSVVAKIVITDGTIELINVYGKIIKKYTILPNDSHGPIWLMYQIVQKNKKGIWYEAEHYVIFDHPLFTTTKHHDIVVSQKSYKKGFIHAIDKCMNYVYIDYASYNGDKNILDKPKTYRMTIRLNDDGVPLTVTIEDQEFPVTRYR